jgi:hypothetical protein
MSRKSNPKTKWNFAIGTTSIVPNTNRQKHYLIGDVDSKETKPTIEFLSDQLGANYIFIQQTKNGFHFFTELKMSFKELIYTLRRVPNVDPAWIGIGELRGYLYLADKRLLTLPWKVTRMILHREPNG